MILGRIPYLNSDPFFRGLVGYKLVPIMPRDAGAVVSAGLVHATIMPSATYFAMEGKVFPLKDFCVAARGAVRSVLLFSRVEISGLAGQKIGITKQTATSSALLDVLLRKAFGVNDFVYTEDDLYSRPIAYLSIGDEALYLRKRLRSFPGYKAYDLGELWYDWTGLPFVYAIWVIRGDVDETQASELARDLAFALTANLNDLLGLVEEKRRKLGLSQAEAVSYIKGFTYRMGPAENQGLTRFRELLGV
ncbi:MAG: menaquinone biosynthesis protein [candidate division WOR-3 bacterium]